MAKRRFLLGLEFGRGTGWTVGVDAIYFGADENWYTGTSWSRPIFDGESETIAASDRVGTLNRMVRFYNSAGGYFIVDNIEFTGMAHLDDDEEFVLHLNTPKAEVKNCYFHGWSHGGTATEDNLRIIETNVGYGIPDLISIHDNVIDGSDSSPVPGDMAMAWKGAATYVYHNYIAYVQNGQAAFKTSYLFGNTFKEIATVSDFDSTAHHQAHEDEDQPGGDVYIFNNFVDGNDNGADWFIYPQEGDDVYIFNNVSINELSVSTIISQKYQTSGTSVAMAFNNTIHSVATDATSININNASGYTNYMEGYIRNNHVINDNGYYSAYIDGVTESNYYYDSATNNATDGYSTSSDYAFEPTDSEGSTVDAGINLSSVCAGFSADAVADPATACLYDTAYGVAYDDSDHTVSYPARTPIERTTWDIGAYENAAGSSSTSTKKRVGGASGRFMVGGKLVTVESD